MDYGNIANFFANYSLPTLVISLIVAIIVEVIDLATKNKIPSKLKGYIPAILAIILQFIYNSIFVYKQLAFNLDVFYSGIMCSSLSTIFSVFIEKLINGTLTKKEAVILLIEGVISGFVPDGSQNKIAKEINLLIKKVTDEQEALDGILQLLQEVTDSDIDDLVKIASEIINSVKKVK